MRKLLIRAYISPLDKFMTQDIILRDRIGTNSGNMLYAFSVMRTLMTEDTEIDIDNYYAERGLYTNEDIDRINSEYDAYVLPLADAFRSDFRMQLKDLTNFIKKLKIPVYLIGMGARLVNQDPNSEYDYDKEAYEFIKAVLDKTTIIGVRGGLTAGYYKKLGFKEEQDFTVIGCPSLFTYGKHLTQKPFELKPDSRISVNYSSWTPMFVVLSSWDVIERYPNSLFVGQNNTELESLYFGIDNPDFAAKRARVHEYLTTNPNPEFSIDGHEECHIDSWNNRVYQQDRMRFFTDVPSWLNYMKEMDFSFGARLHGNITAILAGTPSIIIAKDGRIMELCEYHNLPSFTYRQVPYKTRFEDLLEKCDLGSHLKTHEQRFGHFIDFLNKNGIEHIYKEDPDRTDAPMDSRLPPPAEPIRSFVSLTDAEKIERLQEQYRLRAEYGNEVKKSRHQFAKKSNTLDSKLKGVKKDLSKTRKELEDCRSELEETKKELNSVKETLAKTREHVAKLEKLPSYRVYKGAKKVFKKVKKRE